MIARKPPRRCDSDTMRVFLIKSEDPLFYIGIMTIPGISAIVPRMVFLVVCCIEKHTWGTAVAHGLAKLEKRQIQSRLAGG
jgi:hypothetical protein